MSQFYKAYLQKTQVRDSKKTQKTNIFIIQNVKIELLCVKEKEITQNVPGLLIQVFLQKVDFVSKPKPNLVEKDEWENLEILILGISSL